MEQRKLSVSEIGRCVDIARLLWGGKIGPRMSKPNQGLSDHVHIMIAGIRTRQKLGITVGGRQSGKSLTERMRKLAAVAEIVLDTATGLRNELGGQWAFFELIVRGNTPRALKRKINPRVWLDAECTWDYVAERIEKACGAEDLRELLTLRT